MIVHLITHPVAAKRFVEPLVMRLLAEGRQAELWVEPVAGLDGFLDSLACPKRTAILNLSANPWRMLSGAVRLWRMMRAVRPRVVEAHFMRGAPIPLLVARLLRVPVRIYHNHGAPFVGYRGVLRFALAAVERLNCALATHVLTVSEGMRRAFVDNRLVAPEKCVVLGPGSACGIELVEPGVPVQSIHKQLAKERLGLPGTAFVALYVGRPHRRKGFDLLLSVWAETFPAPDGCLLMAGINQADVERRIAPVPPNLKVMGYCQDLAPLYAAADAVVLPSEHEGLGYALLEGASHGCCLVASRIPGPDTLLRDGETGLSVDVGDATGLGAALRSLERDRALCLRMGNAAKVAASRFDRKVLLDEYAKYIRNVAGA